MDVDGHRLLDQRDVLADLEPSRVEYDGARSRVEQLEEALRSSRTIGAAIGMVMAKREVDYEAALKLLMALSSRTNVKLRDLCAGMVHHGSPTP